jgi:DNA-binding PadR family transcriptional regulator
MKKSWIHILEILDRENRWMFGLEIVKSSNVKIERGIVYIHLSNMEDQGFVERRDEPDFQRNYEWQIPRHQFHITHHGRREFNSTSAQKNDGFKTVRA